MRRDGWIRRKGTPLQGKSSTKQAPLSSSSPLAPRVRRRARHRVLATAIPPSVVGVRLRRIAPREKIAELFGLYALSGKATAFAAPLLVGVFTTIFSSQRAGLAIVIPFLIVGLAIVASVREERSAPVS